MRLSESAFAALVAEAVHGLPPEVLGMLDNVEVIVADWPTRTQLADAGVRSRHDLLGLYEGIPLTDRTADYGLVLPDRITVFQGPLQAACRSERELGAEVQRTVVHELAHHFGIDDDRLEALGRY